MKMSRRKQARPSRHLDGEEARTAAQSIRINQIPEKGNISSSTSEDETSPHICCHCRQEISSLVELLEHQKDCISKFKVFNGNQSDSEDLVADGNDEDICNEGDKRQEAVRRQRQDEENNNNSAESEEGEKENDLFFGFPFSIGSVPGHVTLEALQNTKVAVAQFAATALATNGDNPAALQELAVLQSTLFTLQQQQMMQLSLIQQLQNHLTVHPKEEENTSLSPTSNHPSNAGIPVPAAPPIQSSINKPLRIPTPVKIENRSVSPSPFSSQTNSTPIKPQSFEHQPLTIPKPPVPLGSPLQTTPPTSIHSSLCSISSNLASSIITNNDPPPSLNEPNTLEMLQKRAQEVLDNASQGLLANNLADELAFRKNGKSSLSPLSGGRNEPFFKHRCRYCGKVFGSDSALQIHIRSHTGERPFKCNVCGSRFTTKGNLKVHFQRHTSKFPHIKMNPNPVPEHLDKYHPPLLAQMNCQNLAPGIPSHQTHTQPHRPSPHYPFPNNTAFSPPALSLFRAPLSHEIISRPSPILPNLRSHEPTLLKPVISMPLLSTRDEQDKPENLSRPQNRTDMAIEAEDTYFRQGDDGAKNHSLSVIKPEILTSENCEKEEKHPQPSISDQKLRKNIADVEIKHEESFKNEDSEKDYISGDEEIKTNSKENQRERLILEKQVLSESKIKLETRKNEEDKNESLNFDDCSMDSKFTDEDALEENNELGNSLEAEKFEEQPENLSGRSPSFNKTLETPSQRALVKTISHPNAMSPLSSNSSGSNNFNVPAGSNILEVDPSKDPVLYNSLLPRPGSNDNSWESLIEVTKTSETYKLQQLVDNIEHKLTDPNQCVICHRVLSCKSALQMHYRTHTGERPFRCKICGRAFTTKGNLKTHMGVHRLKPPVRVLHQCPVCHKKFTNALVLQQHIRLHTGEPTDLTPEQIQAAEIKDFSLTGPFSHSSFLSQGFPISGFPPSGMHLGITSELDRDFDSKDDQQDEDMFDEDDDDFSNSSESQPLHFPSINSSAPIDNQVQTITSMQSNLRASELNRSAEDLSLHKSASMAPQQNCVKSPASPGRESLNDSDYMVSPSPPPKAQTPPNIPAPASSRTPSTPGNSGSNSPEALDLTPKSTNAGSSPGPQTGIFSNLGLIPSGGPSPNITSALSSLTSSVLTSTAFSPIGMAVGPAVRGNTTCNICFKTFACNSALEIHYRSHTKERPFKCTICDRGFSTKGNMKQHMLTHKIRDMPTNIFENKKSPPFGSQHQNITNSQSEEVGEMSNQSNSNSAAEDSKMLPAGNLEVPEPPPAVNPEAEVPVSAKRLPEETGDLPIPKRQPSMPKHLCHVCNKNFSSSSALQIHMRTHTGDKPFRCSVCQKAFTTKGNLKVHMGTHMWSNGASRRGRRMSLDLPPIPVNPKDSEFLQRRPDLFYPYLSSPFLNGVQQKLSEISALQSANHHGSNGLIPSGRKFGDLIGFGSFGSLDKSFQSSSHSPTLEKEPSSAQEFPHLSSLPGGSSESDATRALWDPYFDRHVNHNEKTVQVTSPPSGNLPPQSAQREEGLAA